MKTKITIILLLGASVAMSQIKENEVILRSENGLPKVIQLKETSVDADIETINVFLKSEFNATNEVTFSRKTNQKIDNLNFKVDKLQQYYKGVLVEFGIVNAVSKDGTLTSVTSNYVEVKNIDLNPSLSESKALEEALQHIGANTYMWENSENEEFIKKERDDPSASYYPKAELVIIDKKMSEPVLAYKFDVYSSNPLSRSNYYVDARTGEVVFVDAILKHVLGPATTRYSGERDIETQANNGSFRLWDAIRGNGIRTFNMNNGSNYNNASDLIDNDNNWTEAEHNNANRALLDAHWGALVTYDYFDEVHGRNSIDNNGFRLLNYVSADLTGFGFQTNDNAFWDGSRMTYGIGTTLNPLVSLDVIAHEIAHGLDSFTSNLTYERESGAIDESLSDIWGAMVELWAAPEKNVWLLGEDVLTLRSLLNPNAFGQPDTYERDLWEDTNCGTPSNQNDYCGVHTNSGVMNHWFYLLSEGSAATDGVNDNGDQFNFNGIGVENASRIVYRAQTTYFTPNTAYPDARVHTIRAAEDIFGANSVEAITTNNTWYAVGIGDLIAGQLAGDVSACRSPNTTFTLSNFTNEPVNWEVSSNLQVVSSNNTSITVRATSRYVRASGFINANIAGEQIRKDIWVGSPATPTSNIFGPTTLAYGALVKYSGPSVQGATSYQWYAPYPYDPSATVTPDPPQWGIINGGNSRNLYTIVGLNDGLVQFMGKNKCGVGGAKILSVTVGSSTGGGIKLGGGNIPISTLTDDSNKEIIIYPNPVNKELTMCLADNSFSRILWLTR